MLVLLFAKMTDESKRFLGTSLKQLIQSSDVSASCPDLPQGDTKFN